MLQKLGKQPRHVESKSMVLFPVPSNNHFILREDGYPRWEKKEKEGWGVSGWITRAMTLLHKPNVEQMTTTTISKSGSFFLQPRSAVAASRRFHIASLFSSFAFASASALRNSFMHLWNNSLSISWNIFFTFCDRLCTAWFQWCEFLSNAPNTKGKITCWFCCTNPYIWSLFHNNNARSATCVWSKWQWELAVSHIIIVISQ